MRARPSGVPVVLVERQTGPCRAGSGPAARCGSDRCRGLVELGLDATVGVDEHGANGGPGHGGAEGVVEGQERVG